jgi:hypothetical protein
VEGGVSGQVGVVLASWADGAGGEGVVVAWGGCIVGVEAASGAGWAGNCAFGVCVRAFGAGDASGFAHRSCGRAVRANGTARASGVLIVRRRVCEVLSFWTSSARERGRA